MLAKNPVLDSKNFTTKITGRKRLVGEFALGVLRGDTMSLPIEVNSFISEEMRAHRQRVSEAGPSQDNPTDSVHAQEAENKTLRSVITSLLSLIRDTSIENFQFLMMGASHDMAVGDVLTYEFAIAALHKDEAAACKAIEKFIERYKLAVNRLGLKGEFTEEAFSAAIDCVAKIHHLQLYDTYTGVVCHGYENSIAGKLELFEMRGLKELNGHDFAVQILKAQWAKLKL